MTSTTSGWNFWPLRRKPKTDAAPTMPASAPPPVHDILLGWDIAPHDPLLAYFQHHRDHAAASGVYGRDVAAVRNRRFPVHTRMWLNGEITPLRAASTGVM